MTSNASLMRRTTDLALGYLDSLEGRPVAATAGRDGLLADLGGPLPEAGVDALEVVEDLARAADPGLVASGGPRYFGFVIGGSLPAALAADWLTSAWDQNAGLFAAGPAASVAEEVIGSWLIDLLQLPSGTSFGLTTGCQMAHFSCLAAARHAVLDRAGWDVEERGLFGAPEIDVVIGTEAHATIHTALQFLGLGRARVIAVDSDDQGRMRLDMLARDLPDGSRPVIVCLQAGNVNTGAFDPLGDAIDLVRSRCPNAWVHIDGAFGLWAAASPRLSHLVTGHEGADSWASDGHKWLNVPYDCGYAFVADTRAHRASMSLRASYLVHAQEARDPFDWNVEWSRRGRGVATYAALRELGRNGIRELVERCCRHAHALVTGIGALEGAQLMWEPHINQGLVRFPDPAPGATEADHDAHTDQVIAGIVRTGRAFVGGTTWRGRRCMRISVCNWQTSDADVATTISAVKEVLGNFQEGRP